MDLLWYIRYLSIAFDCDASVLKAVWIFGDRLCVEINRIVPHLHFDLHQWSYRRLNPTHPISVSLRFKKGHTFECGGDEDTLRFRVMNEDAVLMSLCMKLSYPRNGYFHQNTEDLTRDGLRACLCSALSRKIYPYEKLKF
jgi:hypothetical protein